MIPITVTFNEPVTVEHDERHAATGPRTAAEWPPTSAGRAARRSPSTTRWPPAKSHGGPGLRLNRRAEAQGRHIDNAAGDPAAMTLPKTGSDGLAKQKIVINTAPIAQRVTVSPDGGPWRAARW